MLTLKCLILEFPIFFLNVIVRKRVVSNIEKDEVITWDKRKMMSTRS
jgi:hypothetical protein